MADTEDPGANSVSMDAPDYDHFQAGLYRLRNYGWIKQSFGSDTQGYCLLGSIAHQFYWDGAYFLDRDRCYLLARIIADEWPEYYYAAVKDWQDQPFDSLDTTTYEDIITSFNDSDVIFQSDAERVLEKAISRSQA